MRVVVDTNILYGDYWFRRSAFRVLVDSGRNVGCILCIPQLVVDELCNKYRENLQTERETIKKGVTRLGRLIDQHVPMPVTENQLDMVVKTFRHRLREMIAAAGGKVLPYPITSHSDLVSRSLSRRLPFSQRSKNEGYRDALLWESVRDLARTEGPDIAFVSTNAKEFADGNGLHVDLRNDLDIDGVPHDRVRYFLELDAFTKEYVTPRLDQLVLIKSQLQDRQYEPLDIVYWLNTSSHFAGEVERVAAAHELGFADAESFLLHDVHSASLDAITDVRLLSSREVLIDAIATLDCEWELFRDSGPRGTYHDEGDIGLASVETHFSITIDAPNREVTSCEVHEVSGTAKYEHDNRQPIRIR